MLATGGLLAIGFALARGSLGRVFTNVASLVRSFALVAVTRVSAAPAAIVSAGRMPYAVSISLGTGAFLVARQLAAG